MMKEEAMAFAEQCNRNVQLGGCKFTVRKIKDLDIAEWWFRKKIHGDYEVVWETPTAIVPEKA